jgi:diaminopimelate epimerase
MNFTFHKYHGAGNDFILIDNREGSIRLTQEQIARLCDRHFGIGADGLMLLTSAPGYDFGMVYYNSDGKESTMCGNGGRCITAFAKHLGIIDNNARFLAIDGEHTSDIFQKEGYVMHIRLKMKDVSENEYRILNIEYRISKYRQSTIVINTGSPHLVLFIDDVSAIDVVAEGRRLRNDPQFAPDGINVDFVQIKDDGSLFVRTYERGVENETLSCGTGVTAAAIAFASAKPRAMSHEPRDVRCPIITLGGKLTVSFRREESRFTDIRLEGPAEEVFRGEIALE